MTVIGETTPVLITATCDCGQTWKGPRAAFDANHHCEETGHGHWLLVAFANQQRVETSPLAQPLTGSHGQPGGGLHQAAVRRLTPLECERLQGFPDGWTAGQSDSARYRQLGNAVAVPCVEWIARRIAAVA